MIDFDTYIRMGEPGGKERAEAWKTAIGLQAVDGLKTSFDRTGPFASYMTRSSYGIYIVHYLVIVTIGYLLKVKTQMSPVYIYLILTIAVFTLSPLIYEIIRRIPFIRWCVLGEKK